MLYWTQYVTFWVWDFCSVYVGLYFVNSLVLIGEPNPGSEGFHFPSIYYFFFGFFWQKWLDSIPCLFSKQCNYYEVCIDTLMTIPSFLAVLHFAWTTRRINYISSCFRFFHTAWRLEILRSQNLKHNHTLNWGEDRGGQPPPGDWCLGLVPPPETHRNLEKLWDWCIKMQ